ncbi:hypothetical protein KM176_12480 [Pseudooceanicola sp. CBS1P-1]|uniref:Uncharacterized protein n=1 Tax=Pseudooceanicola albus TaxID=2692189 RepID=A0A6L7G4C8_9RHOB|nr:MULTISPECIES: hypothetical protein [Pseudooceanicola]MBT9384677.1 hypothetical protein [Pseudooceanicola endophyticus]MXN18378.1 hypothetical protein [Pseudooceanicola albus]
MIPDLTNPLWRDALKSSSALAGASLATRMVVARLRVRVSNDPGQLADAARELHDYFVGNRNAVGEIAAL